MENGEIVWADDAFPDNIMDILVDEGNMELELDPQDDSDDENIDD